MGMQLPKAVSSPRVCRIRPGQVTHSERHRVLRRQAKQARKDEEGRVGKAQMDAALAAGASWGLLGEDAAEEIAEGEDIEWRTYAETHSLTDKQVLLRGCCARHRLA